MHESHIILNFHGIGTPQRVLDPGEEPYWLSLEQFQDIVGFAASMRGVISCKFTIDDSNMSDATIAGPHLAAMGFPTQIFVLTGRIGQKGAMDRAALLDLIDMGHTIGSHGHAHRDWKRVSDAEMVEEIQMPKQWLQELTGQPVEAAGLPFGGYNRKVLAEARRAGFSRLYSSDGGMARDDDWPTGRTSLRRDMTAGHIKALFDLEPLFLRLKRRVKGEIKKRI
jgi:peptidoglycan/xylan/chitin deacetylase (PgdA/CDA1 family)